MTFLKFCYEAGGFDRVIVFQVVTFYDGGTLNAKCFDNCVRGHINWQVFNDNFAWVLVTNRIGTVLDFTVFQKVLEGLHIVKGVWFDAEIIRILFKLTMDFRFYKSCRKLKKISVEDKQGSDFVLGGRRDSDGHWRRWVVGETLIPR